MVSVTECVKCGAEVTEGAGSCSACTWPFCADAWKTTTLRIQRLTLDTGCVNAKARNESLNTLERWAAQGLLELQRSDAMLDELSGRERIAKAGSMSPHPGLFVLGFSTLDGPDVLAGPDLQPELREVLFPTAHPITDNQIHDVEHLRLHVLTGGDVFVTLNPRDFIARGRQKTLSRCGIWIMQPPEIVCLLHDLYAWSIGA